MADTPTVAAAKNIVTLAAQADIQIAALAATVAAIDAAEVTIFANKRVDAPGIEDGMYAIVPRRGLANYCRESLGPFGLLPVGTIPASRTTVTDMAHRAWDRIIAGETW